MILNRLVPLSLKPETDFTQKNSKTHFLSSLTRNLFFDGVGANTGSILHKKSKKTGTLRSPVNSLDETQ